MPNLQFLLLYLFHLHLSPACIILYVTDLLMFSWCLHTKVCLCNTAHVTTVLLQ